MSHTRFIYAYLQSDKTEEAIALFRDTILPTMQTQPGFQGARFLLDREIGKVVIVTIWASEADMKATETSGFLRQQLEKLNSMFIAPPIREGYELVISV